MKIIISPVLLESRLREVCPSGVARSVTGPGRSGAVASAVASYILRIPFIPYGAKCPPSLRPILIVDTARQSGRTIRKALKKYAPGGAICAIAFNEPPRVHFWYEFPA